MQHLHVPTRIEAGTVGGAVNKNINEYIQTYSQPEYINNFLKSQIS